MHGAVTHAPLRLRLAQIGALFGSQNAIFVKHRLNILGSGMLIDHDMFRVRVCVRWKMYSYNEVDPNSASA